MSGDANILNPIIDEMPFLEWIHSITAGVDHIICPAIISNPDIILTNAKGVFSASLAEYVIGKTRTCIIFKIYFEHYNLRTNVLFDNRSLFIFR